MAIVIRGVAYMVAIAAIFGFWQHSILAGIFMLFLLLFMEKLVRVILNSIENLHRTTSDLLTTQSEILTALEDRATQENE